MFWNKIKSNHLLLFLCMNIIPAKGTTVNPIPHRKRKKGLAASVSTR